MRGVLSGARKLIEDLTDRLAAANKEITCLSDILNGDLMTQDPTAKNLVNPQSVIR